MNKLLNDTEAAIKLGITKELLYAYIRNAPKKQLGHKRKLNTEVREGRNYFYEKELIDFDKYLNEPWSNPKEPRPDIPKYIQEYLKVEIGGKCPISGKGYPLENAHIVDYAISLNHHHHNLIRISKEVHTKADNGVIPKTILRERKQQLIEATKQRLQQEDKGYRSSFKPPNPNSLFVGRLDKLMELTAAMEFHRMVVIQGIGGIGKTQLLLNGLHNVQYHNPVLWIDVETVKTINDLVFLLSNAISEALGHSIKDSLVNSLRGERITIVLDSLEKLVILQPDETEDLIHALMTQTDKVQLLITSQVSLSIFQEEKAVIELSGLNGVSSKTLLLDQISEELKIPDEQLDWIIKFSGGHPLVLKIISGLLSFYKSSDRVITHLQKHDSLKQPLRKKHNKENALSVCLNSVYESLQENQRKLLHIAKFYPAGVKKAFLEQDYTSLYEDIAILNQFFLIENKNDLLGLERLSIPNPLQKFLFDKANIESEDKGVILQKEQLINIMTEANVIAMHYIESAQHGPTRHGIVRMDSELYNILNAFRITQHMISLARERQKKDEEQEYLQIIVGIAGALGKYCFIRGRFDYGTMLSKAGIEANIALGQISFASTQYMYLAQLQLRQYDHGAFEKTCRELCELAEKTNNVQANRDCLWMKGNLAHSKNKFQTAIDLFQNAKELLVQEYKKEKSKAPDDEMVDVSILGNIALLDSEIAHAYSDLGDFQKAIKYYNNAIEKQKEINDETNLMSCYHQLANCMTHMGNMDGLSFYFKAIEGFRRNGQFEFLSNSVSELGRFVVERTELASDPLLDEESIECALGSISYQFNEFLSRQDTSDGKLDFESLPFDLLGKAILVMKLVSFTDYSYLLFDWAEEFRGKIDSNSEPSYFTAFLNVAHIVGGFGYERPKQIDKERIMKPLLQGVLILNGGPDLKSQTFIFYWLAAWIKHSKIDLNATAETLLQAAWDSFEDY